MTSNYFAIRIVAVNIFFFHLASIECKQQIVSIAAHSISKFRHSYFQQLLLLFTSFTLPLATPTQTHNAESSLYAVLKHECIQWVERFERFERTMKMSVLKTITISWHKTDNSRSVAIITILLYRPPIDVAVCALVICDWFGGVSAVVCNAPAPKQWSAQTDTNASLEYKTRFCTIAQAT